MEERLAEDSPAELEAQMGVRLPAEYRTVLTQLGAGGAGPSYGVYPVRRVEGRWRWEGHGADLADLSLLLEPFPEKGPDPEVSPRGVSECPEEDADDLEPEPLLDDAGKPLTFAGWYLDRLTKAERTAGIKPSA